jgi:hypothetical protein
MRYLWGGPKILFGRGGPWFRHHELIKTNIAH